MLVLMLICQLLWLTACATERIVEKPVPVEIVKTEYVPIPTDLLRVEPKQVVPEQLTYGQAIELWAEDRASLEKVNGRLKAVGSLEGP